MKKYLFIIQLFVISCSYAQCTFERCFDYYENQQSHMLLLKDGSYLSYGTGWRDTLKWPETNLVLIKTDSCGNIIWINDSGYPGVGDPNIHA